MIKTYQLFLDNFNWEISHINDKNIISTYHLNDHLDNQYKVEFIKYDEESVELKYYYNDNGNWSVTKLVGTNPFKLISTIFGDILTDFIKNNNWCNEIYITGVAKDREKYSTSQRTKFYLRYLLKNIPIGFSIEVDGNDIILYRK